MDAVGHSFVLQPFPAGERPWPAIGISGRAERVGPSLDLVYQLTGDLAGLEIPALAAASSVAPDREQRLWEHTCFEFFLAPSGGEEYWEGNFSPSGQWNLYHFSRYREGMAEERRVTAIAARWQRSATALALQLKFDFSPLVKAGSAIALGISAIIEEGNGRRSYWSLAHPAPQPDFHQRSGFRLAL